MSSWKIGDEVLGLAGGVSYRQISRSEIFLLKKLNQGAYAEYIAVYETHIIQKPSHLTWTEAASIPEVFLTGIFTT